MYEMDIQELFVGLLGAILTVVVIRHYMGNVPQHLSARLKQLGFRAVLVRQQGLDAILRPSGGRFVGTYKAWSAGYCQGWSAAVRRTMHVGTYIPVSIGMEFWLGEGLAGPDLAIVERGAVPETTMKLPKTRVPTGDADFDKRFLVLCDVPSFVSQVVTPNVRSSMSRAPVPCLIFHAGRVLYPILRSIPDAQRFAQLVPTFLDTCGALAQEIRHVQERNPAHAAPPPLRLVHAA